MTTPTASLAMYPFDAVRPHYTRLWDAVVAGMPVLPATLDWPDDVHRSWWDDDVVVKQTCGWPLVTRLAGVVRVVGAFHHSVPGAVGHRYRAAIVARAGGAAVDPATARIACNSPDSLSGWVSLISWSGSPPASVTERAVRSGSHIDSLRLLQAKRADIASIDAVTLAHVRRHRPELVAGLTEVGEGPLVPSLPVVASRWFDGGTLEDLREAFTSAVEAVPPTTRDALMITGFEPLRVDDYRRDLADLSELMTVA